MIGIYHSICEQVLSEGIHPPFPCRSPDRITCIDANPFQNVAGEEMPTKQDYPPEVQAVITGTPLQHAKTGI